MKFFILFNLIFILLFDCSTKTQTIDTVEGLVSLEYALDTIGYERYWIKKKSFTGMYFIEDISDVALKFGMNCDSLSLNIAPERITLYELNEFKNQSKQGESFYQHYGGDTYINRNGEIIICFYLKADVLYLKEPPCKGLELFSSYECPVEVENENYPLYIITNVIEARSLTKDEIDTRDLRKYDMEAFEIGKCD